MSVCSACRASFRLALGRTQRMSRKTAIHPLQQLRLASSVQSPSNTTAAKILAKPTWSVASLVTAPSEGTETNKITSKQLRHLLRLAALPQPKDDAEEQAMIATLQSQLHFVDAVQRVNTDGVEPLRAIRDETKQGIQERTFTLDSLRDVLSKESLVGHYKRPKRVKETVKSEAENWDALSTASKKAGKYFVVEAKKAEDK